MAERTGSDVPGADVPGADLPGAGRPDVTGVEVPEPLPDEPRGPLAILARWIEEAGAAGVPVPSTMTLATAGDDGPRARTVLVTTVDDLAVRFHSSTPSGKTLDLAVDARASGVFHWPALGRQVVLAGRAEMLSADVSDAAFRDRPRQLQLVAWAYDALLGGLVGPDHGVERAQVAAAVEAARGDPGSVHRPASWTTIELVPDRVDVWRAGSHDVLPARTRFVREGTGWRSFPVLP